MNGFLTDLAARRRFGMKPGLDTIRTLCAALGDPQASLPCVHIAGTNGKGAVAAILDSCLRAAGLRVGRYTSPHLQSLNERFFLDGRPVADEVLEPVAESVRRLVSDPARAALAETTFFEALTAVAFRLYAEARVDCAVLETGLGGRLDATNICRPAATVITRIGLDHCDWLGDTVERIAGEKAGIIKPGVPVVLGENVESVRAVIREAAERCGAPYHDAPDLVSDAEIPDTFALRGSFNRENARTALATLKVLDRVWPQRRLAASDCVRAGCASVVWPGRFQRIGGLVVDGAHNPPAARALVAALREEGVAERSLDLIVGFCGDKDVEAVLDLLHPFVRRARAVRTTNPRSLAPDDLVKRLVAAGYEAEPCAGLDEALARLPADTLARDVSAPPTALVCGSLFLAGEALVRLGALPWAAARHDPSEQLVRL